MTKMSAIYKRVKVPVETLLERQEITYILKDLKYIVPNTIISNDDVIGVYINDDKHVYYSVDKGRFMDEETCVYLSFKDFLMIYAIYKYPVGTKFKSPSTQYSYVSEGKIIYSNIGVILDDAKYNSPPIRLAGSTSFKWSEIIGVVSNNSSNTISQRNKVLSAEDLMNHKIIVNNDKALIKRVHDLAVSLGYKKRSMSCSMHDESDVIYFEDNLTIQYTLDVKRREEYTKYKWITEQELFNNYNLNSNEQESINSTSSSSVKVSRLIATVRTGQIPRGHSVQGRIKKSRVELGYLSNSTIIS